MKRVFLAILALILVLVFGFMSTGFTGMGNNKPFFAPIVASNAATRSSDISLGSGRDLSLLSKNIKWTPDGHITYATFANGKRRYFLSGNQRTYTIDTNASLSLEQALASSPTIKENFGPDKQVSYRNYYAAINSVIQTEPKNLNHLMAFAQYEEQAVKQDGTNDYANFTSSIGLLESYDGGNTWKDFGPVIRGDDYLSPGIKISGAGEPSAIINNGFVYVYFVDWASGAKINHPDQIYLARSKIGPTGGLGVFEYLNTNGFSKNITELKPVIMVPEGTNINYASLPSISYNKSLNQYFAVFETNIGFYQAISTDGIVWTGQKLFMSFTKPMSERQKGDIWTSYPTLLSEQTEKSDGTTKNTGNFYYGKGIWPDTAHQLMVKSFEFK